MHDFLLSNLQLMASFVITSVWILRTVRLDLSFTHPAYSFYRHDCDSIIDDVL